MIDESERITDSIFTNHFASALTPPEQDRWYACQARHIFNGFYGKKLVLFSLDDGISTVLRTLVCAEIKVNLRAGVASLWKDEAGVECWVGHKPAEVAPSCFLMHMQNTGLVFNEHKGRYNLRFSMLCRSAVNPMTKRDGHCYLLEYSTYESFFPKAA